MNRVMGLNRETYGKTLVELGAEMPELVVLEGDIGKSTQTKLFGKAFPERYFNLGVQEQNEVCIAAGLATTGKVVFASTFAIFLSMRACEQIRTAVAYPKLNVKIVATNAGVEIAGDGATHQAVEDFSTMRVIPNLQVFSPSDPIITEKLIRALARTPGPAYVRLGRQETPILHASDVSFEIGRMISMREGEAATLISTGHMTSVALEASDRLAVQGIRVTVLDCHTIKPLDTAAIHHAAERTGLIVTLEDHHVIGGLGSAVSEVITDAGLGVRVLRIGLEDVFPMSGRDYRALLAYYGLCAESVAHRIAEACIKSDAVDRCS